VTEDQDAFATAFQLHVSGFHVIPSGGGDSGKAPLVEWREYQDRAPTDEELEHWRDTLSPKLWGIVTNSTVAVLDADTVAALADVTAEIGEPHVLTPRGGGHWYINTTGRPFPTKTGILPGVDVRGEGGFVNVCGRSALGEYRIVTLPHQDNLIRYDRIPGRILDALNSNKRRPSPAEPITEGQRNATLASIAGSWRRDGLEEGEIVEGLLRVNTNRCQPPLPEAEVQKIATSVARYPNSGYKSTSLRTLPNSGESAIEPNRNLTGNLTEKAVSMEDIEEWVRQTQGWFSNDELDRELGYHSPKQKQTRLVYLRRLAERGIVQRHPTNNRLTRILTTDVRLIDFRRAGQRTPLEIGLPFDIHKLVNIYPGNIVVLAGAPNAGKTAFMLNVVRLNQSDFPIYYMSSEMGAEEFALRLEKFPGIDLDDWNFTAWERVRDFADVIVPDAINIVDYYEFTGGEAFYQIGEGLRAIWERLGSGVAFVAIQKTGTKATGRGGDFGLEKPRLYLSMDAGKLRIHKGKNWADPLENPNGLTCDFKLTDGCNFHVTRPWYRPEEGA